MQSSTILPRHVARWVTLVAALLQFAGAVVGPLAHRHLFASSPAPVVERGSPADPGGFTEHSEIACLVCQAITAVAVVPGVGSLTLTGTGTILARPDSARLPPSLHPASTRARAPPLV